MPKENDSEIKSLNEWLNKFSTNSNQIKKITPSALEDELKKDKTQKLKDERLAIENQGLENDIKLKKSSFKWVLGVVSIYLIFIGIIISLSMPLSDNVLITLLTTTTINIIALPRFIIRHFFK
jgi:hypothetical protein